MPHPNPEQRKRVEREIGEDLLKPTKQLLADIHDESVNATSEHAPLTRTTARFASLLCVLSDKAEVQTRRIVKLTWGLILLTVGLLILTFVLAWIAHETDERIRQIHQIAEQQKTQQQTNVTAPPKP